jgi:hypothetical protein
MYAAFATRPDISYVVAAPSHDTSWPFTSLMTTAKGVLLYLKSTADFQLHFNGIDISNSLVGYSDSRWANDSAARQSQRGHAFLPNNGAISWQSSMQCHIAMSTLEAAFIACSEASSHVKWLLQLQKGIHGQALPPLPINCNNQSALTLITTGIITAPTNHIDVCYHNSGYLHRRRIVNYFYIHTDENVADILTKALTKDHHMKFMKAMCLW